MLPPLREELHLYPGPASVDGSPSWSLHDPVRHLFFRIDWLSFEILSRWHLNDPQAILAALSRETPLQAEADDIEGVARFLDESELIQRCDAKSGAMLYARAKKRQGSLWEWWLHHYLFFRIPLWQPDGWLQRTQAAVAPFFNRGFFFATMLALVVGLIEVSRQWGVFAATLLDMFSWQGLLGYFLALVGIKTLHELGHAYTAKRYGCRVPTMGVAFLVLFPMAYTDVNDVWKLPERRQRLAVGAAGILTELAVAAWATLAWCVLPDGQLRSVAFLLATTTWISTVVINASPFLRFDGYFLLMDWLDMPNLHQRAGALGRWRLREMLFGLNDPVPEYLSAFRTRGLIWFAYVTWIYRLLVFGGIALLVYVLFPKPVGPLLAMVEVGWFILLPVFQEVRVWRGRLDTIRQRRRSRWTLTLLAVLLLVVLIPWDRRIHSQAVLKPSNVFPLVATAGARIASLPLQNGQWVEAGSSLLLLESLDLDYQFRSANLRAGKLRWQAGAAGVESKFQQQLYVIDAARNKVGAELSGIAQEVNRYRPVAPFSGRLFYSQPDLKPGLWVEKNERLAELVDLRHWTVETYLSEEDLGRIQVGDGARFYSETPQVAVLRLEVEAIDHDATHSLPNGLLASTRGGSILVREKNRQFIPEVALYRVSLRLLGEAPKTFQTLRGSVAIQGRARALASRFLLSAAALFRREAGF